MVGDQPLKGQKALVTGAISGIGEGIARALAAARADVAVNYVRRPEDAERLVAELQPLGVTAMAIRADVSREAEVRAMFREMVAAWETIDILVSNAGLQRDAALIEMTLDQWNTVLEVNLTGTFLCVREAARETPGAIQTPINRAAWETPEALGRLLPLIPYGRIGQPADIGKAVVWLASDDADYVHGQTLFVDGGMTLYPEFARGG
jgi:NAD(P)-dependent dehydrogenase (short-subunit alcohol dehydrogenase family)